jgi:hypothetical protein
MPSQIIDVNTIFGAYPSQHADSNADTLIKQMESHSVVQSFALSTWGIYYQEALGNEYSLRAQTHFAGKISAVATISPHSFFSDATVDLLVEQAFSLFRFFPVIQGWPIDYAPFEQILRVLGDHKRPIMVTTSQPGHATALSRLAANYPAPVILEGVSSQNTAEALCVLQNNDQFYVETHDIKLPGALETFRDRVGIDRLLFGSAAPALSIGSAIAFIESSTLSGAEQSAVLSGNARKIFLGGA